MIKDFLGLSSEIQSQYKLEKYNFEITDNVKSMHSDLKDINNDIVLSLLSSGYYKPWQSKSINPPSKRRAHSKKNEIFDFDFDGYKLIWNSTERNWSSKDFAKDEIGSVFTLQGADLNYCGVIIGNDIYYDKYTDRLEVCESNVFDRNAIPTLLNKVEMTNSLLVHKRYELLRENVLNAYYVLLTRGIKGTYVYFVDDETKKYFNRFYDNVIVD